MLSDITGGDLSEYMQLPLEPQKALYCSIPHWWSYPLRICFLMILNKESLGFRLLVEIIGKLTTSLKALGKCGVRFSQFDI